MKLSVEEARTLAQRAMMAAGHTADEGRIIADHLIDCELRGMSYGGMSRAVSICDHLAGSKRPRTPIRVVHETPLSALIDGGNNVGYLVALRGAEMAIAKARQAGVAVVGMNNTWYTGMLSNYAEMAAKADLVSMIASNAAPWVAPHGATEGRFGTNPICFGFPSDGDPIIWDIGTSTIMHADIVMHGRLGKELPEGVAFGPDGKPTRDPKAALEGAIAVWGGHKGSGLGIVVQLLGAMCAAPALPDGLQDFGCLMVLLRPDLMMPAAEYKTRVSQYAAAVRSARPVEGGPPVRMPFDRSAADRRRRLKENVVEVPDAIYSRLSEIAARA